MSSFKTKCPHCGLQVEVPENLQDQTVACPSCEQEFTASRPTLPKLNFNKKTSETNSNISPGTATEKKSKYPWGRFYIAIARFFAGLILLGAIIAIGILFHDAFSLRSDLLDKLQAKAEKVAEKQNTFSEHFEPLAEIVLSGNHSQAKFNFPADLGVIENSFSEKLMSEADLQESIDTVNEYEAKLRKMTEVMHMYFQKNARKAYSKLDHNNTLKLTLQKGQNKDSSLTLHLSKNVDFYSLDPDDLQRFIDDTLTTMHRTGTHRRSGEQCRNGHRRLA